MHSACASYLSTVQKNSSRFQLIDPLRTPQSTSRTPSRVKVPLVFTSRRTVLLCISLNATCRILLFPPRIVPFTALGQCKRPRSFASCAFSLIPSMSESFLSFRSVPLTSQSKTQLSHLKYHTEISLKIRELGHIQYGSFTYPFYIFLGFIISKNFAFQLDFFVLVKSC